MRRLPRRLLVALVAVVALAAPVAASAHPLGNFTINRYSELSVSGNRVYVLYVLDLAEIPTFQAGGRKGIRGAAYARRIAANLDLTIDGRGARLVPVRRALAFRQGQGGLQTTRLEVVLAGPTLAGPAELAYRDGNYAGRLGWKEIVVRPSAGARLTRSTAPDRSVSDRLLAYPEGLLQSPLDVSSASAAVVPGPMPGAPPALASGEALEQPASTREVADSGFAGLIGHDQRGAWFVVGSLFVAFFWGAAHGLSPGHGKAIVAGYLIGARGTARHALLLGATVTVTHTIGVFALGLVTLSLSQFIVPDELYPWLNLVSALLIVGVGVSVLRWRLAEWRRGRGGAHAHGDAHGQDDTPDHLHDHGHGGGHRHAHRHDHLHDHGHAHDDAHGHDSEPTHGGGHGHPHGRDHRRDHAHSHDAGHSHGGRHHRHDPALGLRGLLGVGISGGIIPCPTALVVLLAAVSLHRVGYGLVLIVAFSLGLAATVSGIGLLAIAAKDLFGRLELERGLVRLLPAASAVVVLGLGIAMTVRALPTLT